ncbi:UNVERIFIED_CONTAM: hypothetical protein GTU68_059987 [Idotea baltica]|nr:hypothetical protein [Idotea baltica]
MNWQNTKVWITGASSGIGEALAYELSAKGAELLISARRTDELERVKSSCEFPSKVHILPLDLAQMDTQATAKVNEALELMGNINILVNNAGISQRSLVKNTVIDVDKRMMQINYIGTVALTKALLPHFIQQQQGRFVVVTSLVGVFASPYRSSYAASKHALHGFFDALRAEHYNDNIKVTIVCPGFVQTNISKNALKGDGSKQQTMDTATNTGITAQRCAKGIAKAITRNKAEVYIGRKETVGVYVKRFFPALYRNLIRKVKVK